MAAELLKRSEVREEDTWNVKDMYESVEDWEKELTAIRTIVDKVAEYEGKVMESAGSLLTVLSGLAEAGEKLGLAFNYAERLFDEDQTNTAHQAMNAKAYSAYAEMESRVAFVDPEIIAAPQELLERYYEESDELPLYRKQIEEIRRRKAHCLSAEMEKLLAMTAEMSQTPADTFSILSNADLVLPEVEDENGEKVRLTSGRYGQFIQSADRRVRKDAFEAMYSTYKQFLNTFASLYNGNVKQQIFQAKARKYASTLEAAVDANHVSPDVYKNLIETVSQNLDKMHRYVSLRKKCLGTEDLHMYDIYTPMIPDMAKTISFEEAKETVLKALAPLGEDYVAKVKEGFENRWIDVYENQGKRSGAYSAGAYGCHPYVLLNYNGTLDDVFTLAHEMGHAMHSYYSNETQPYIYAEYKIFVAEVASTCNEALLIHYLMEQSKKAGDRKKTMYLINYFLEQFRTTLFRQTMFAEFEKITHGLQEQGETLTADRLCEIYYDLNKLYFGEEICVDQEIAMEWARIPHFYTPFYVYQYATGFSAAIALSKQILEKGASAVEQYKKFLKGGSSMYPLELLKMAGVDMEQKAPVQDALAVFAQYLDEMERLADHDTV